MRCPAGQIRKIFVCFKCKKARIKNGKLKLPLTEEITEGLFRFIDNSPPPSMRYKNAARMLEGSRL